MSSERSSIAKRPFSIWRLARSSSLREALVLAKSAARAPSTIKPNATAIISSTSDTPATERGPGGTKRRFLMAGSEHGCRRGGRDARPGGRIVLQAADQHVGRDGAAVLGGIEPGAAGRHRRLDRRIEALPYDGDQQDLRHRRRHAVDAAAGADHG